MILYLVSSALLLFAFWLLLSGYFTAFLMTVGAASAIGVVLLARRMEVVDQESVPIRFIWRIPVYWPWLFKEIAKSAWSVSRIIIDPRLPVSPTLVRVRTSQKTTVGVVTYANWITLTPGTISVDVTRDAILVHALTGEGADGMEEGEMDRRVTQFEGLS